MGFPAIRWDLLRARLRAPGLQVTLFAVGLALVKISISAVTELTSNEAYHWLYARHPALGYFNHPALSAWTIWLSTALFGNGTLGVRMLPILSSSLAIGMAYLAGRRLYGEREGRLAALLVGLVPELFEWTSLAYPDSTLVLFWILAIWAMAGVGTGGGAGAWAAAGAFLGLAMMSKYHGIFIALGALGFLLFSRDQRRWLARPHPYLAALLALAVFSPALLWNAQHDWRSFRYQGLSRLEVGWTAPDSPRHFFPLTELVHLTPVVALWAWGAGLRVAWRWKSASWQDRLAMSLGFPVLVFFTAAAFFIRVRGHWTVAGYPGVLILASAVVVRGGVWGKRLHAATIGLLGLGYLVLAVVLLAAPRPWLSDWSQLAGEVRKRNPSFVLSANYHVASQMGYHLWPIATVDSAALGLPSASFQDWWRPGDFAGKDAVIILPSSGSVLDQDLLQRHFDRIGDPEEVWVTRFGGERERFVLRRALGYHPPQSP